jgi:hypothetical protein
VGSGCRPGASYVQRSARRLCLMLHLIPLEDGADDYSGFNVYGFFGELGL